MEVAGQSGFKKRNLSLDCHCRVFSGLNMEWRPGAGTGKRKKVSRDLSLRPCLSVQLNSHSPSCHDPNFLRTLQANALRSIRPLSESRDRLLCFSPSWTNRTWSKLQMVPRESFDANRKRQLDVWDCAGVPREKMRLLNEIEALIDSEENAINMEASAKAAEGRLRSLLDICICNQCQENFGNRMGMNKVKTVQSGKVFSTRTNGCFPVNVVKQEDYIAAAGDDKKSEIISKDAKKQEQKPKEKRFFVGSVKEAMERDRIALDEFLRKQKLKNEVSKKQLEEVKVNFEAFFGRYLKYLEKQEVPAKNSAKKQLCAKDTEEVDHHSTAGEQQVPELQTVSQEAEISETESLESSNNEKDQLSSSLSSEGRASTPAPAPSAAVVLPRRLDTSPFKDVPGTLRRDARKLHETIHKLLDKNRQLQAMLSGRDGFEFEHITKLEIPCSCECPWGMGAPRIFNYSRRCSRVVSSEELTTSSSENFEVEAAATDHTFSRENATGFPQGYSYLYVSPAFEAENVDPNNLRKVIEDRSIQMLKGSFGQRNELVKAIQTQELIHSQAQNFCPKFKLSPAPSLCETFTQTCNNSNDADEEQSEGRTGPGSLHLQTEETNYEHRSTPQGSELIGDKALVSKEHFAEVSLPLRDSASESPQEGIQHEVSMVVQEDGMLMDIVRHNKRTRTVALLENQNACTQTSEEVEQLNVESVSCCPSEGGKVQGNALLSLSLLCQQEESKLKELEVIDVKDSYTNLVKNIGDWLRNHHEVALLEVKAECSDVVVENVALQLQNELQEARQKEEVFRTAAADISGELWRSQEKIATLEKSLAAKDAKVEKMFQALKDAKSIAEDSQGDFEKRMWELSKSLARIAVLEQALAEKSAKMEQMSEALTAAKLSAEETQKDLDKKLEHERSLTSKVCNEQFQSSLDILRTELSTSQETIASLEQALAEKEAKMNGMKLEMETVQNAKCQTEMNRATLESKLSEERQKVKQVSETLDSVKRELSKSQAKTEMMEEVVAEKKLELQQMEMRMNDMETAQAKQVAQALDSLKLELLKSQAKARVMEDAVAEKTSELERMETRLKDMESTQTKQASETLDTVRWELSKSQVKARLLEEAVAEKTLELQQMEMRMNDMVDAQAKQVSELSRSQAKARRLEEAVAEKTAELQRMEFRIKELENAQSGNSQTTLARQLEDARNSVKEMVQILGTERMNNLEKSAALEEVIAGKNARIREWELKVQEMENAKFAVELELQRATDNVKGLHATLHSVKTDLSKVDDKAVALEKTVATKDSRLHYLDAKAQSMQDKMVALEFENFQFRGRSRDIEKQAADQKRQFDDLMNINEDLLRFAEGKEKELVACQNKVNDLQKALRKKVEESTIPLNQIEGLRTGSGQTQTQSHVVNERYKALKQNLADTEYQVLQRDEAIERLTKSLAAAVETEEALLQEAEHLNMLLKTSQFKEHELSDQIAQLRMEKQGLEDSVRGLERKLVLARVEIAELNAQNAAGKKSSEDKDKEMMQLRRDLEQQKSKGQILEEDILEKEGQIAILKESFSDDTWLRA